MMGLVSENVIHANWGEEDTTQLQHLRNLKERLQAHPTLSVETVALGGDLGEGIEDTSDNGEEVKDTIFSERAPSPIRPGVYVGHEERARQLKLMTRKYDKLGVFPKKAPGIVSEQLADEEDEEA